MADHLQTQLEELDHREARINSQEAEFETRIRNARLWLDERETELDDREKALDEKEQALADQDQQAPSAFEQTELKEKAEKLAQAELQTTSLQAELECSKSRVTRQAERIGNSNSAVCNQAGRMR